MRAQIKPKAAAGARQVAPALERLGTVTVVVRFEMRDFAECATRDNLAHSQKVRVPTAILKNGDQSPAALCQGDEFRRFGECVGERLVHHNVFAGVEGLAGEIEMRGIGRRDYDQINFWKSERFFGFREHCDVVIFFNSGAVTGNDMSESQSGHIREQRRVKSLAGKSIAE